jgi:hypothetical protein
MSLPCRAAVSFALRAAILLFAFAACATPAHAGAPASSASPQLRWPLEAPAELMSSFGEYRYDHLHAGIDISTAGVTGVPVLAAGPGQVVRLKVEWRGYGRALYLRHPDGRTTVYGHLERYEDRALGLERRVARRQAEMKTRYPGDIYLDPPVRVRRGQVIGYSGESGVGLPHLHFEVRTPEDAPIDPFASGLAPPHDRRPPVIESLIITAAVEATFIDGSSRERSYRVFSRENSAAVLEDPIRVTGPFLAAVMAFDPVGGARAGIHSVELRIDGTVRYGLTFKTFRFSQYPLSGLVYDHRESRLGPSSYAYRLFRLPGNVLAEGGSGAGESAAAPLLAAAGYPGAYDLPPGAHAMEVVVADAAGNRTTASACVQVARPGRPKIVKAPSEGESSSGGNLRFSLESQDTRAAPQARSPLPSGCPERGLVVEGDLWDGGVQQFVAIDCRARDGICSPRRPADDLRHGVVRLREVRDGVPGPWVMASGDGSPERGTLAGDLQVAAWPGFLDLLVPAQAPLSGGLLLPPTDSAASMAALPYRDGRTYGRGLSYASLGDASRLQTESDDPLVWVPAGGFAAGVVRPGKAARHETAGISVDLPSGARFFPGALLVRTLHAPEERGLEALADAVELLPEGETLDEKGTLTFRLKAGVDATPALGIYRWDRLKESWSYEGGEIDAAGRAVSLSFRRYGRFALLKDVSPPRVTAVRPADGSLGVDPRVRLEAAVVDAGVGLNFNGLAFVLDGVQVESEFDPDRGLARVFPLPRLSSGRHTLAVTATDRAGNFSPRATASFTVAPPGGAGR